MKLCLMDCSAPVTTSQTDAVLGCVNMKGYRVFLCSAESFTTKMRKLCFLTGAGMRDISADAFIPSNT
jgi:hypothetical protein